MIIPGIPDEPLVQDGEITKVMNVLRQLEATDLESQVRAVEAINRQGITASILKAKRHGKYDDAFILGISTRIGTVAIKIHLDCFVNCKRIYDSPELMSSFQQDADMPPIISTFCIQNYRIVLYPWQSGMPPLQAISGDQEENAGLITLLQGRINSLLQKNHGLRGITDEFTYPEQDEFLVTGETPRLIVLDLNQIIPTTQLPASSHELAQRLVQTWIQRKGRK